MREIKFRAWRKHNKTMSESFDLEDYADDQDSEWGDYLFFNSSHPDDYIIMQYTGLKDKNGKEIYEGDIITYLHETYKVKWDKGLAAFNISSKVFRYTSFIAKNSEIIGNIYENPELLKEN